MDHLGLVRNGIDAFHSIHKTPDHHRYTFLIEIQVYLQRTHHLPKSGCNLHKLTSPLSLSVLPFYRSLFWWLNITDNTSQRHNDNTNDPENDDRRDVVKVVRADFDDVPCPSATTKN
jgi:hypothetical protein